MAIKELKNKSLTWINIDAVDAEALTYLKNNYQFHPLDFDDIQSKNQTPKLDTYKNYIFMVLQFPKWNGETNTITPQEVDIFIGEDYLITIQHTRSKAMKNFFYRCMKTPSVKKDWMNSNSGYLLYKLIEALFKQTQPTLNEIGNKLTALEEEIFEGDHDPDLVKRLATHRRNILHIRRILDPERYLVSTLSHTRRPFLDESLSIYFDDVLDYLNKLWAIIESYRDTVEGLHTTVESLITHRTNQVIGALTVISVALLPLTLLSGIYGMNVDGLPFAENPTLVWTMFGALGLLIVGSIIYMRRKNWI